MQSTEKDAGEIVVTEEELRKALRFYADHRNYEDGDNEEIPGFGETDVNDDVVWTADGGYIARVALGIEEDDEHRDYYRRRIPAEIRDAIYAALQVNPQPSLKGPISRLERIRDIDEDTSDGALGSLARYALDELAAIQGDVDTGPDSSSLLKPQPDPQPSIEPQPETLADAFDSARPQVIAEIRDALFSEDAIDEGDGALFVRSDISERMVPDFRSGLEAAWKTALESEGQ